MTSRRGTAAARRLAGMPPGPWKLEPSMTGVCAPDCAYYRMRGAPQHRHWQQQPPSARRLRPMGPVMRALSRLWGEG